MNDQTIIRSPHGEDRPYVATCRASAQDRRLSWEARGLLWYLLSKPDDWQVMIPDLMQNCGRDKVRNMLAELLKLGYLEKPTKQPHADHGHFASPTYRVHEVPFVKVPLTEKPSTAEPSTAKRPLHNKEVVHSKEETQSVSQVKDTDTSWISLMYMEIFAEAVSSGEATDLIDIAKTFSRADINEAMRATKSACQRKRIIRKVAYMNGILQSKAQAKAEDAKSGENGQRRPLPNYSKGRKVA